MYLKVKVISLRREDAERLGFNNGQRFRDLLRTQTDTIATNLKIPLENLRWYGAFHNEGHHPHVHLMAYSINPNEGYLTEKGIENIRSSLAKDIFSQDLISVYAEQTKYRNAMVENSRELVADIVERINNSTCENIKVEELLWKLAQRLDNTSGKKVYGYLKADVKAIIDNIVDELAKEENIARLYDLWYEKRFEVLRTYTDTLPEKLPLSQQKEFKSIKNAVIEAAMGLNVESHQSDYKTGAFNLLVQMSRIFKNKLDPERKGLVATLDRKQMKEQDEKKQAHGLR